jgi:ABC-2 type transport system permease protein
MAQLLESASTIASPRAAAATGHGVSSLSAAGALAWREMIRFFRQPNRIVGAVGTPIVFWILFGLGLQGSFRAGGTESGPSFLQYYFPGSLVLTMLFTAIFSTISVIEDRREGILQAVLVSPTPRWGMVLGKVLGGTLLALSQALIFLLAVVFLPFWPGLFDLLQLVALLFVAGMALTSVGLVFAWRTDSTQGFHAVMNLVLMPMWLLSGAFFPAPAWSSDLSATQQIMHVAIRLNPLSYSVAGARHLLGGGATPGVWMPSLAVCWTVTILFAALAYLAAWRIAAGPSQGDLT